MDFIDLQIQDYQKTYEFQITLVKKRLNDEISDTVIFVEHPHTLTFGKRGVTENILVANEILADNKITIVETERGGDITYHGPGQLVCYPIFKLNTDYKKIKSHIHKLEKIIIDLLEKYKIQAKQKENYIGAWVDNKKIASIGVAVKKWVTFHGFALNVSTDLSYFNLINPCGLNEIKMTSMEKILENKVNMNELKQNLVIIFNKTHLE
ncbi:MAG: lipoyl(octanoyl) transferase LipB [Pseudomonadota bacterium]